jgi:hypothetical protein
MLLITDKYMKIYRLKVTYEIVVRGSSAHAVECAANRIIRDSDDEPESDAVEITDISELPMGWDGNCRPWGVTDPHDRTLREILGHNVKEHPTEEAK